MTDIPRTYPNAKCDEPVTDWNAPIPGQAAAIVVSSEGQYLARFPAQVAGGMDNAKASAEAWRKANAPRATVREFTGEFMLIWNDAQGFADLFRAMLAAGFDRGAARNIMAEKDQEAYAGHIAQARESYASDDVEIDDTPEVSAGGDPGAWVAAWVWVSDDEVTPEGDGEPCREDWRYAVENGDTKLGFEEWAEVQREIAAEEQEA